LTQLPEWMQSVSKLNPLTCSVHRVRYWLKGADVGFDYMNWYIDLLTAGMFSIALTA
jgi:ABC-type polysaccharide/polyol phosphate export permease